MKLNQLDGIVAFAMVADTRSFTAAAAKLEVSPPAISQSLRQLEERLGVRLLNRTTRSVSLTEAGERFYERVSPALGALTGAAEELNDFRDGLRGELRINAPHILWEIYLRELIAGFLLTHPGMRVEVQLEDGFVDIVKDGFDLGVRLGESVQRDMIAVPFTSPAQLCLAASPDYLARRGTPHTLEDLPQHDCIRYRFRGSKAIYRWELLRDDQLVEVDVEGRITCSDSRSMREAALDGLGIGYLFARQVERDLTEGKLVGVLQNHWPSFGSFCLYYPNREQMPAKLRAFIDFCKQRVIG